MIRIRVLGAVCAVFICFIVSCATTNMELKKKQSEASRGLGEAYLYEGDYTAALREFLKAEGLYPKDPFLQNDLGLTYLSKGKPDLAVDHFKKALELRPDYAPAKNNLGTAYLALKNWDAAIVCFKEVTGNLLYATPHYPLLNLGSAYYHKKEYELAEKYYIKTLSYYRDGYNKDATYAKAVRGLSQTYIAMEKISSAVKLLEKAIKDHPRSVVFYFDLARAYKLSGKYKKALSAYAGIVKLAPGTDLAEKAEREAARIKTR